MWALARPKDRNLKRIVSVATVNRWRATLKKALRMGKRWKLISSVPDIPRLKGEKERNFVFTDEILEKYDAIARSRCAHAFGWDARLGSAKAN